MGPIARAAIGKSVEGPRTCTDIFTCHCMVCFVCLQVLLWLLWIVICLRKIVNNQFKTKPAEKNNCGTKFEVSLVNAFDWLITVMLLARTLGKGIADQGLVIASI